MSSENDPASTSATTAASAASAAAVTEAFAAIAPRVTGSMSAISSSIIIYIIARSKPKLSTIYHRLVFGMSLADILASIAMGLTTLAMPAQTQIMESQSQSEHEFEFEYDYDYENEWTRIGNAQTCSTQGFLFILGTTSMFIYNTSLCIYYTCAIAFQMNEEQIITFVEPLLHFVPIVSGFILAIVPLSQNAIHMNIPVKLVHFGADTNSNANSNATTAYRYGYNYDYEAWCTVAPSPFEQDQEYIATFKKQVEIVLIVVLSVGLGTIVCSLVLIACRVIQTGRTLTLVPPLQLLGKYKKKVKKTAGTHKNTNKNNSSEKKKRSKGNGKMNHSLKNIHSDAKAETFRTTSLTRFNDIDNAYDENFDEEDPDYYKEEFQDEYVFDPNYEYEQQQSEPEVGRGDMPSWKLYNRITDSHRNTKIVLVQAMAYIFSFLITFICPFVRSILPANDHNNNNYHYDNDNEYNFYNPNGNGYGNEPHWLIRLQFILMPLQGFFNALIFISHKIFNYRRLNGDVSRYHVFKLLFTGGLEEPVLISRISLIKFDKNAKMVDVELANERLMEQRGRDGGGGRENYNFAIDWNEYGGREDGNNGHDDGDGDDNINSSSKNNDNINSYDDKDGLEHYGFSLEGQTQERQEDVKGAVKNSHSSIKSSNSNSNSKSNSDSNSNNNNHKTVDQLETEVEVMDKVTTRPRRSSLKSSLKSKLDKKSNEENNRNVNWSDNSNRINYYSSSNSNSKSNSKSNSNTNSNSNSSNKRWLRKSALRTSQNSNPHSIQEVGVEKMTSFGSLSGLSPSLNPSQYEGPNNEDTEDDDTHAGLEAHSKSKGIGRLFSPSMHLF